MSLFGAGMAGISGGFSIASSALSSSVQQSSMKSAARQMEFGGMMSAQKRRLDSVNENYGRLQNLQDYNFARKKQIASYASTGFRSNSASFIASNDLNLSRAMARDRMSAFNSTIEDKMSEAQYQYQMNAAKTYRANARIAKIAGIFSMASAGAETAGQIAREMK